MTKHLTTPPPQSLRALIADDAYVAGFQTVSQYRTALLRHGGASSTPEAPDTRRLDLLLRSDGFRFELVNQQQHLLDPRGRIAGKGFTKREAIDDALGGQGQGK